MSRMIAVRSITGTPERRLEIALLARRQLVVAGDQVRVRAGELGLELVDLAGAEVGVGVRVIAPLDELAHAGDPGGAQQLAQLGELLLAAVGDDRDQIGALARAAARSLSVQRRRCLPGLRRGDLAALKLMLAVGRSVNFS